MLRTSCIHSLPLPLYLSRSSHKFGPKLLFAPSSSFRVSETHQRFSTNKWEISCFHDDEFLYGTPNQESAGETPNEPKKAEIDTPNDESKNRPTSFEEIIRRFEKPWIVPWTARTILKVFLLCNISSWLVKEWIARYAVLIVGMNRESITLGEWGLINLMVHVNIALAWAYTLFCCLSKYRPLPSDWFRFSLQGNWPIDVIVGWFVFPLIKKVNHHWHHDPALNNSGRALSNLEMSIKLRDPIAFPCTALILTVLTPLWEGMLFRGFLLPSLTRYMPVWCSILVTSAAYAIPNYVNVRILTTYIPLGVMMGVSYARTRNLVPPVLIHILWNVFMMSDLIR